MWVVGGIEGWALLPSFSPTTFREAGVLSLGPSESDHHLRFDRPFVPAGDRYRDVGLSGRKGVQATRSLTDGGWVRPVAIRPLSGRGRPATFYEMTPEAVALVGPQALGPGRGGLAHRYYQRCVRDHFVSLGHRARIEAHREGKAVDVGVWKTAEDLAVEIELSPAHCVENVTRDLAAGWNRVAVVFVEESVGQRIRDTLVPHLETLDPKGCVDIIPLREIFA